MNEKAYKTMGRSGAESLALGIIIMVTGIICGVMSIINGAKLLHDKKEIMF